MTLLAAALAMATTAPAAASPRVRHCVVPEGRSLPAGTDLNAMFGYEASIANNSNGCGTLLTGAPWGMPTGFYFSKTWQAMPPGFVPAGPTPRQDFIAKFVAIRYVVDKGTRQEFSVEFPNSPKLWTGDVIGHDSGIGDFSQYDWAQPMTLGSIRPLSPGTHTVDKTVIMSGPQCDGLYDVFEWSCLPAGETYVGGDTFTWVAR